MKMLIFLTLFFAPLFSFAQTGSLFSYEGILTDAGGTPITTSSPVTFQILYGGSCVTFEETQSVTPGASGEFSVIIGAGVRTDSTGNTIAKIFASSGTVACQTGGPQTLSGFAVRQLHVRVGAIDLLPDVVVGNVPFSWNAQKLADKSATDFIQVNNTSGVSQTKLESIFARYTNLDAMLNGDFSTTPTTGITNLTNASIAAGAAIDRTKIANGTINHVVINSATGGLSSEAQLAISRGGTGLGTVPTNGQLLIGNGAGYTVSNITAGTGITVNNTAGSITISSTAGVGSVTSVATGAGLTGGPITGAGTIGLGPELAALNSLATMGILQRTGANTYTTIGVPAGACGAGEALTWQSPVNAFVCYSLTVDTAHISGLNAAVDARIVADTTKLPVAGGTMTGNINMNNNQLSNVGYVHLQNKAADPAGLVAGNEGFVWYNSNDKLIKYYNGTAINSLPGYAGTCADGQILKWNNATKVWTCGTDAGSSGANATQLQGTNISAAAPTTGQFLKYSGTDWSPISMPVCGAAQSLTFTALGVASCNAIAGLTDTAISASAAIARTKLANGTANHVLINNGSGVMSSEAQLAISRGGTGVGTAPTADQVLVGNATSGYDLKTLTAGTGVTISTVGSAVTINATATAPVNSSYDTKGVVGFQTDAVTSGMVYSSAGIAKVNTGTAANQIVKLDGTSKLPAVDGSALLNINDTTKLPLAGGTMTGAIAMGGNNVANTGDITMAASKVFGLTAFTVDPGSPVIGQVWYNSTSKVLKYYDGTVKTLGISGAGLLSLNGETITAQSFATSTAGATLGFTSTAGIHTLNIPIATAAKDGLLSQTDFATFNNKLSAVSNTAALASGKIWIGDGTGKAQEQTLTGDVIISNTGTATLSTTVSIAKGGTGQTTATAAFNALSPMTTKGDIIVRNGANAVRLAVGTDGQALVADSAAAEGVKWGNVVATDLASIATTGIVQRTGPGTYATLGTTTPLAVVAGNIALNPIANADVAAGAAITRTKLANGTANRVVINTTGGVMSEAAVITANSALISDANGIPTQSAVTATELGYLSGVTSSVQTQLTGKVAKAGDTMTGALTMNLQNEVRFAGSGATYVGFKAPSTIAANKIWTLPAADGNTGQVLKTDGAGNLDWVTAANGTGDFMKDGSVAMTGAFQAIAGTAGAPSITFTGNTNTGIFKPTLNSLSIATAGVEALRVDAAGNVGIGTSAPGAKLDVKGAIRMSGATSGYTGFQPAAAAGSTVWTLPAVDGTAGYVLKTDGAGNLGWIAQSAAPGDATYAAKGLVQFSTDAATSGINLTSGIASVNRTTSAVANTILQLDASSKAMIKGLDLKGTTSGSSVTLLSNANTGAYTLTLPLAQGGASTVLQNDGSGGLSWVAALTSVNSTTIVDGSIVDADINASAGITRTKFASGTANHVLINDGSGVMSSEAQLLVSRGGTGSSTFVANGLVMAGGTGTSPLQSLTCAALGRSLEWTGSTWGCSADFLTSGAPGSKVNYVLLSGGISASGVSVSAAGANADVDLNLNAKGTAGVVRVGSKFQVDYETVSKTFRTIASGSNTGTVINFANGNLQYTTSDCGPMTINGMLDGATYVLAVKGTVTATCSFTASGLNIKLPPDHGATEPGKSTLYTFMVMGTDVYVSWVTGY